MGWIVVVALVALLLLLLAWRRVGRRRMKAEGSSDVHHRGTPDTRHTKPHVDPY